MTDPNETTRKLYADLRRISLGLPGGVVKNSADFDYLLKSRLHARGVTAPTPLQWVEEALTLITFQSKVVADSGWAGRYETSCYYVSHRTVTFRPEVSKEEIQAFIEAEKNSWYGQEFDATVSSDGTTVHLRRAVDSSG